MSDTLTADDIKDKTVERGPDGELIPDSHEINWGDETKTVKTVPITTGVINRLSHIDDEIANLEPKAVHEAFETLYVEPSPDTFTVEDIQDLDFEYLEALMQPLDKNMSMDIGDEGNRMELSKGERARKMR